MTTSQPLYKFNITTDKDYIKTSAKAVAWQQLLSKQSLAVWGSMIVVFAFLNTVDANYAGMSLPGMIFSAIFTVLAVMAATGVLIYWVMRSGLKKMIQESEHLEVAFYEEYLTSKTSASEARLNYSQLGGIVTMKGGTLVKMPMGQAVFVPGEAPAGFSEFISTGIKAQKGIKRG